MPSSAPHLAEDLLSSLRALGERLRVRRKELGLSVIATAEAAGMSRITVHRIERGEPSVSMGAWLGVAAALGLDLALVVHGATETVSLPDRILLNEYPQLRALAWQTGSQTELSPEEALHIYERNWRHIDVNGLQPAERSLIRRLSQRFGRERLLV